MPELPEVETVIKYLNTKIINENILDVQIKNLKFLKNVLEEEFKNNIINQKIINISRKGKYIIFKLSNNFYMISHLRMEGKYFVDNTIVNRKHDYLIFKLSNDKYLSYNDSRQFGTFHLSKSLNIKELDKISIDPLDYKFNYEYLHNKIHNSNKNIKLLLLDQEMISGIGNIYASEILFDSKISPFKKARELEKDEINRLVTSSKKILEMAIKFNGTTIHSFSFGENKTGQYNNYLKVVYRENKNCLICNEKIIRIKQQSRSTFYCPECQK